MPDCIRLATQIKTRDGGSATWLRCRAQLEGLNLSRFSVSDYRSRNCLVWNVRWSTPRRRRPKSMRNRNRFEKCDVYGWQRRFRSVGNQLVRLHPMALQHVIEIRHVALLPSANPRTLSLVAGRELGTRRPPESDRLRRPATRQPLFQVGPWSHFRRPLQPIVSSYKGLFHDEDDRGFDIAQLHGRQQPAGGGRSDRATRRVAYGNEAGDSVFRL